MADKKGSLVHRVCEAEELFRATDAGARYLPLDILHLVLAYVRENVYDSIGGWVYRSAPDLSAPDLSAPDLSAPDLSAPDLSAPDLFSEAHVAFRKVTSGYVLLTTRCDNARYLPDLAELVKAVDEEVGQIEKACAEAKAWAEAKERGPSRRRCFLCSVVLSPTDRVLERKVQCTSCNYRGEKVCGAHQTFRRMMDAYDSLSLLDPTVTMVPIYESESETWVECPGYCFPPEDMPDSDYVEEEDEERNGSSSEED